MKHYLSQYFYIIKGDRKNLLVIVLFFLTSACLDALGLGLIVPLVSLITNNKEQQTNSFSDNESILFLGLALVLVFFVKGIFGYFVQFKIIKFSSLKHASIVKKLMKSYLNGSYEKYLEKKSADIIRNITTVSSIYINETLIASLKLVSDSIVIIFIIGFLAYTNIVAVVALISIILFFSSIYIYFIKGRISGYGKGMISSQSEMIDSVRESFRGFLDVKLYSKQQHYLDILGVAADKYANDGARYYGLLSIPRFLLEFAIVLFIVGMLIYLSLYSSGTSFAIATVSVFGAASLRVVPAANSILSSISFIHYSEEALRIVSDELRVIDEISSDNLQRVTDNEGIISIELKHVYYRYIKQEKWILKDISLSANNGQCIAIIGKTGSGKTTLANLILGLLHPSEGEIIINGNILGENQNIPSDQVSCVPQDVFISNTSIKENIAFAEKEINYEKIKNAITLASLDDFLNADKDYEVPSIGENGNNLSGGQKQRIALARAVYFDKRIIVFDEPTSALDKHTESKVKDAIKEISKTKIVFLITHNESMLNICDKIYLMENGELTEKDKESLTNV